MTDAKPAGIAQLKNALGYEKLGEFRSDWKDLPDTDKDDIRKGVTDGTFTY